LSDEVNCGRAKIASEGRLQVAVVTEVLRCVEQVWNAVLGVASDDVMSRPDVSIWISCDLGVEGVDEIIVRGDV
jgi:hypothetical protein